ncbi:hypothetical protein DPQ25_00935 [Hydrogeniiclostridium mannosilyticum]|uniref:Holin n=1 Tax=Hydrogeniiclostridium mannosilyticum TaxID=2764322 RepID=A0A328UEQ0_9FIRM|nr:hypothetical protein DPQ25_00935 [Hydrogeniiclostridium mannosilyticum]
MHSIWLQRLSNLLCVKSIVTIILTIVFACLAITGKVSEQDFLTVFSVVIAFYFGTQSQRLNEKISERTGLNK